MCGVGCQPTAHLTCWESPALGAGPGRAVLDFLVSPLLAGKFYESMRPSLEKQIQLLVWGFPEFWLSQCGEHHVIPLLPLSFILTVLTLNANCGRITKGAILTKAYKMRSSGKHSRSIVGRGGFECSGNRGLCLGRADPSWVGSRLSHPRNTLETKNANL